MFFREIRFLHLGREFNEVAHKLARYAIQTNYNFLWTDECPVWTFNNLSPILSSVAHKAFSP